MSKIFMIGDVHLALGYPNKLENWYKVHKEYFNDFLIPLLKSKVKEGDIIVGLGDFFDNRNVIPIDILNYAIDIVETIAKIAPFHMIIGNHDLWSKSTSDINTMRPFRYIPNVYIYSDITKIKYNNINILMMPYIDKRIEQIKHIQNNKDCQYLFCHSDLNGAKMHLTSVALKNPDKIDVNEFSAFKKVYSGHLHIRSSMKNVEFVGSIFQMDRNDIGDQKGITVLDTNTDKSIFIPNKISPIFMKFTIKNEEDVNNLEQYKNSKNYIDLIISNNLLISNRKLRRRLEGILENGNFATIEYLDDITEDLVDGEEIKEELILESNVDITSSLDFNEYIKDYILKQKYDNEIFKNGVLQEFDEITKIYTENYINKNNI